MSDTGTFNNIIKSVEYKSKKGLYSLMGRSRLQHFVIRWICYICAVVFHSSQSSSSSPIAIGSVRGGGNDMLLLISVCSVFTEPEQAAPKIENQCGQINKYFTVEAHNKQKNVCGKSWKTWAILFKYHQYASAALTVCRFRFSVFIFFTEDYCIIPNNCSLFYHEQSVKSVKSTTRLESSWTM